MSHLWKIVCAVGESYQRKSRLDYLCGKAYVVHEADIVTEGEVEK